MISGMHSLKIEDLTEIESVVLDQKGKVKVVDADVYNQFSQNIIAQLAVKHGMYCLPTTELIQWLKEHIANRKAIEVGAGCGIVGRAVGIKMTDNFQQDMPKYKMAYAAMQQPIVQYGKDVLKYEAVKAVKRFKPQVVLGCWVTHKYRPDEHDRGGNEIGLREEKILKLVDEYIVVGNDTVHNKKPIMDIPHEEFRPDWLVSRSLNEHANCIYIWK